MSQPKRDWFFDKCLIEHWFPGAGDPYQMTLREFNDRLDAIRRIEKLKAGQPDEDSLLTEINAEIEVPDNTAARVEISLNGLDVAVDEIAERLIPAVEAGGAELREAIRAKIPVKNVSPKHFNRSFNTRQGVYSEPLGRLTHQIVIPFPWRFHEFGFVMPNGQFHHNPVVQQTAMEMEGILREKLKAAARNG